MENADGIVATAFLNNEAPGVALDNSTVICFDRAQNVPTAELTYDVIVAAPPAPPGTVFVNEAIHLTDNQGDEPAAAGREVLFIQASDMLFWNSFE